MLDIGLDTMTLELILRLLASIALGGIVGLEREISKRPAGLRTHMLVCMGACLFTVASLYMLPQNSQTIDYSRIAAGIVTGIGFIGAGSIIANRGHVRGVTTAASLWMTAAIGLIAGMGNYILATAGAVLSLLVLMVGRVEKVIESDFEEKKKMVESVKSDSDGIKIELRLPKELKSEKKED